MIVYDESHEESQAPSSDGWRDDRMFPVDVVKPIVAKKPGRPKKVDV